MYDRGVLLCTCSCILPAVEWPTAVEMIDACVKGMGLQAEYEVGAWVGRCVRVQDRPTAPPCLNAPVAASKLPGCLLHFGPWFMIVSVPWNVTHNEVVLSDALLLCCSGRTARCEGRPCLAARCLFKTPTTSIA